jgi:hypothetical protein
MATQAQADLVLLEASDVARELNLSYSGVRVVVGNGKLAIYAVTRRGVKLFKAKDVEALKRARKADREGR